MINTKKVKLDLIKLNPNNPRLIKDDKFKKLVQSIKDFPEMLNIRPIVVNTDMVILGGNMRYKACKEAGLKEIPIIITDLSEDKQREFLIKDNTSGGEWDFEMLANEWDVDELTEWGLEVPTFETDVDYSEKNKELNLNDFEDQKYTIKLEYSEDDYNLVKERLQELGQTAEKTLYDALISL
jgi:ParB-like chromosome segregation protein Spo0J